MSFAGLGLIPAHAGKIAWLAARDAARGAHPRSRGENVDDLDLGLRFGGSSPLTRGKSLVFIVNLFLLGLIPAHAGKIPPPSGAHLWGPAHPRSRGENNTSLKMADFQRGSSPLTRGKWAYERTGDLVSGLIPAHAGKIVPAGRDLREDRAHPRSRGENITSPARAESRSGSSPLTRGKSGPAPRRELGRRLIPAHAGKMRRRMRLS